MSFLCRIISISFLNRELIKIATKNVEFDDFFDISILVLMIFKLTPRISWYLSSVVSWFDGKKRDITAGIIQHRALINLKIQMFNYIKLKTISKMNNKNDFSCLDLDFRRKLSRINEWIWEYKSINEHKSSENEFNSVLPWKIKQYFTIRADKIKYVSSHHLMHFKCVLCWSYG